MGASGGLNVAPGGRLSGQRTEDRRATSTTYDVSVGTTFIRPEYSAVNQQRHTPDDDDHVELKMRIEQRKIMMMIYRWRRRA